ncbi:MAG: protein kinase [Archangiaceae bacterium]|nr:protein kinase [Archangiaceae bacterium]
MSAVYLGSTSCPECGREVPPEALTCPFDGTDLVRNLEKTHRRDPIIGLTLGEYVVEERIGVGGMGIVYRAVQPLIGKSVAIKVLRPELADDTGLVTRMLDEARAVAAIGHRGIVDVFGFGKLPLEGRPYLVMEYLQGRSLESMVQEGRLPVLQTVELLVEILAAIGAAHGAGVVHRDLKPSNVIVVEQAGARFVKVLDFGLALKRDTDTGMSSQTSNDLAIGTPEYISPEQACGHPVGPPTDLYAIGVMAFEMLTQKLPFNHADPFELARKHVEARPPRVSSLRPEVLPELDRLVTRLLEKDPADRPQSADEVIRALKQLHKESAHAETKRVRAWVPPAAAPTVLVPIPDVPFAEVTAPDAANPVKRRPRWLVPLAVAAPLLVAMAVAAWLVSRG